MHGSSSVPEELVGIVNQYGGAMPNAKGVDLDELKKTLPYGVSKINVDTDGRIAMTGAIRKVLTEKPEEFDPRKYLGPAREALKEVVKSRMQAFGAAGNASKIKQISLDEVKNLY